MLGRKYTGQQQLFLFVEPLLFLHFAFRIAVFVEFGTFVVSGVGHPDRKA